MARLSSARGKATGKVGGSVYYVNHGVQIEREYSSEVSNPNTNAQVGQRSRFKLASQVSAALSPVIAFPRKGIQSPRNQFVKRNMGFFYGDGAGAMVTYENLQLAQGNLGLPRVIAERPSVGSINLSLDQAVNNSVSRVIYGLFTKTEEEQLLFAGSVVVEVDDNNTNAGVEVDDPTGDVVIYAYGMRDNNDKARAKYGQYQVTSGTDIARLVTNRVLSLTDYSFTQTRGVTLGREEENTPSPGVDQAMIYVTDNGFGSVTIKVNDGAAEPITDAGKKVSIGDTITLAGTPVIGHGFIGWFNNGEQQPFSTETSITFVANGMRDIIARWNNYEGLE